jgi:ADP-heptose:LPS heptosyltransferase
MTGEFPILLLALCEPSKALALSGLVARLKAEIPHARITLATTQASAVLFQDDDLIDELQAFDGALFKLKSLHGLSELSRRKWGLCVDIGPTLISRMMKAKTRFTLNPNDSAGVLEQIAAKLKLDPLEIMPALRVSPRREAQTRSLIDSGRESGPLIVMAPGAGWLGRRWPTERFAVLATRLMREDGPLASHRLLIIGSEAERDTLQALRMATPRAQVMEIAGDITELNAYSALRQTVLFVGNDELWLHLSAAAGIPTFGLFGPSDEAEAPIGGHVLAIRGPRSLEEIQMIDPKLKQNVCHMLDLTIDHVAAVIEREMAG